MLDYHSIGNRIRKYRKRCGYTQEELGLSIDTSGPYINNIERAVKKPSLENLADIAERNTQRSGLTSRGRRRLQKRH